MATTVQLTIDCGDPQALAQFWMTALHYVPEPPPSGYESWDSWLTAMGVPQSEWNDGASIGDPEMVGPMLYFQKIPEPKTVKNRLHMDLDIAAVSDPLAVRVADVEAEAAPPGARRGDGPPTSQGSWPLPRRHARPRGQRVRPPLSDDPEAAGQLDTPLPQRVWGRWRT
jgi:hypothetical protein